jgi:glycosyltransferase involved in cell wall biosynthesis
MNLTITVIITDHNYARFLPECLESVQRQTLQPVQVLVICDRCTDQNYEASVVACRNSKIPGIRWIRTDFGNVQLARSEGLKQATGTAILFLDADNLLDCEFLKESACDLGDSRPQVAAVFPVIRKFRVRSHSICDIHRAEFSERAFFRENYIDACSLVWKHALDVSWLDRGVSHGQFEDHHMWAQMIRDGWSFRPAHQSVLLYRVHDQSMSAREHSRQWCDQYQPKITLFMPATDRTVGPEAFYKAAIQCRVDDEAVVRHPLQGVFNWSRCLREMFRNLRVIQDDSPSGLADLPRLEHEHEVQLACCRIYNRFARELTTEMAWIVEDDVFVPPNALRDMLRLMDPETIAVSAVYPSRFNSYGQKLSAYDDSSKIVAWTGGTGRQLQMLTLGQAKQMTPGTTIAGSGFGCLLIRREALQHVPLSVTHEEPWYDPRFFRQVAGLGKVKLATNVICDHWLGN